MWNRSQTQKTKTVHDDRRTLLIEPWELQANAEYELQVRAKPRQDSGYGGVWSEWSLPLALTARPAGTSRGSARLSLGAASECLRRSSMRTGSH